jgi:AraC-like DNA-binding protein
MLPTGYERWILDARTFLISNIGSTYAAETECSRILLTRGLAMMKLGKVCLIPFMYNQTEPSFDVVTQSKITTEAKSEMLKAAKLSDGAVTAMEGWEFRIFISLRSRADCSNDIKFACWGKHIVVGGLKSNVACAEILRLIRPVVDTTRLVYAYIRKMRCSKELILYTDQDVSTISIICHIPDQCRAPYMETYCYTQIHTPGRDRVKDYNHLLGRNQTAMHWGFNSQAQFNV